MHINTTPHQFLYCIVINQFVSSTFSSTHERDNIVGLGDDEFIEPYTVKLTKWKLGVLCQDILFVIMQVN
jgi:hypothetical protein